MRIACTGKRGTGHYLIIDRKDVHLLRGRNVKITKHGYPYVQGYLNGKIKLYVIHKLIIPDKLPRGFELDHFDGNKLNARRKNIRIVSQGQNSQNRPKRKGCSSQYRGVSHLPKIKRWQAYISTQFIGNFKSEREAAKAYDRAALIKWGPDARTNFKKKAKGK